MCANGYEKHATAYLGFGANLGDRAAMMERAVSCLIDSEGVDIDPACDVASLYESDPVGGPPGQPLYLNTVVRMKTAHAPEMLLAIIHGIEDRLGRTRRRRWEARVIDIDILLYGKVVSNTETLTLPHPRLHERRFVLEPLAELAGDLIHPVLNMTITELAVSRRDASKAIHQCQADWLML